MNGEMFLTWVQQGLALTLHPGDVVILDNLATHAATTPNCSWRRKAPFSPSPPPIARVSFLALDTLHNK